jgi:hypothetical protein
MKRILVSSLTMLFMAVIVLAESTPIDETNQLYADKKYSEAILKYEEIIDNHGVAPELYYNLGNAYFRINELGKAILNYERAVRIAPGYADAKFNLEFANQKVIDNIEISDTFFLKKWIEALMKMQTSNTWFIFAAVFFIVSIACLLLFVFGNSRVLRKSSFYIGVVFLIVSVFSLAFSGIRKNQMINHNEGIVMTGAVVIKGSPDKSGTDLFQLHEGTKVFVVSTLGEWYEVKLPNGSIGWVEIKHVEKI